MILAQQPIAAGSAAREPGIGGAPPGQGLGSTMLRRPSGRGARTTSTWALPSRWPSGPGRPGAALVGAQGAARRAGAGRRLRPVRVVLPCLLAAPGRPGPPGCARPWPRIRCWARRRWSMGSAVRARQPVVVHGAPLRAGGAGGGCHVPVRSPTTTLPSRRISPTSSGGTTLGSRWRSPGHSLLPVGPSGTGKTMLAQRFIGLLQQPTADETLALAAIRSVAGRLLAEGR